MEIESYRLLCRDASIAMTNHAKARLQERKVCLDDIESAIFSGIIIEKYPDDAPFPSCLIAGKAVNGNVLHTVISTDGEFIYIITAYWPDPDRWTEEFTKRKEG
ncbi:MAG: DUF4258 domain-containing protein [Schwartzia sp.]|nr:DUF4258 domain-containing protein [Schwartzia sp. (in: firmicutes)]